MRDSSTQVSSPSLIDDNFGFAFNDSSLSDRILLIKIMPDSSVVSNPNQKYDKWFSSLHEASHDSESCAGIELKIVHISSPILAARSSYFYKLFKNGMKESQDRDIMLMVSSSEEAALMELLYFMYHKTLTLRVTSAPELLDVLMAADKFGVISCARYCLELLVKLPMSLESALLYLELPLSVAVAKIVQPLLDSAKQYFVENYKNITKCQEKMMELRLSAVEAILGNEGLQVNSEDEVYDFILEWARAHYTNLEERREILTKRLTRFINFPYMSCAKLEKAAFCQYFENGQVSKLAIQALCDKVEAPYGQHVRKPKDDSISERVYNNRLIKVVYLEFPWPHCVVYFDLRKDDCANLISSKKVNSQVFPLGGQPFFITAQYSKKQRFGLFLDMKRGSKSCDVGFEFAVMNKLFKEFESRLKVMTHIFKDEDWGKMDLLGITWDEFMGKNCEYFIDGIIHLRVEVIIHSISED